MRLVDADVAAVYLNEQGYKMIKRMPTIDAVPVVRCKDCAYYEGGECGCPCISTSDGAHIYTYEDDFCSYAEPKARDEE